MIDQFVSTNEASIRLVVFIVLFSIFALSEWLKPRRPLTAPKTTRWFTNWTIVVLDSLVVRLIFPIVAVGTAVWAKSNGYGLLNMFDVPFVIAAFFAFFFLDFSIWFSHLASHKVPMFWRIHRMHHSDVDIDVSTALRFHPIEIALSLLFKMAIVVVLGAPAISVILFEIVLNGGAMFNHSNTKLPLWLDRYLRWFIVTPDMHRVHHSIIHNETDSNYGFNFSFWDRMFGTYVDQPSKGHDDMTIGLPEWQDKKPTRLDWSLMVPFRK